MFRFMYLDNINMCLDDFKMCLDYFHVSRQCLDVFKHIFKHIDNAKMCVYNV